MPDSPHSTEQDKQFEHLTIPAMVGKGNKSNNLGPSPGGQRPPTFHWTLEKNSK